MMRIKVKVVERELTTVKVKVQGTDFTNKGWNVKFDEKG